MGILGYGKTSVEHILVVFDNSGISAELVVKFVLGVGQNVALVTHSGGVRHISVWHRSLIILAQVGVEGAIGVSWAIGGAQATGGVGDVCVAAATVINIYYWFGVDVGEVMLGALFQKLEGTC